MKKKIIFSLSLSVLLILSSCGKQVDNIEVSTIVSDDTTSIETMETKTETESESSSQEKEIKENEIKGIKETVEQDSSSETSKNASKEVAPSSSDKKPEGGKATTPSKEITSPTNTSKNPLPSSQPKPSNASQPSKAAHTSCTFDGGKVTTNATCNAEGKKTFTCTACGKTKSESIDKTSHNNVTETVQPTCTEAGKVKIYCTICGAVESETTGAGATGHNMVEQWRSHPTCKIAGYRNIVCSNCKYVDESASGSVPRLDHNKVSSETTYDAEECEYIIFTNYYCADCDTPLGQENRSEAHHTWGKVTGEWGEEEYDGCVDCGTRQ